MRERKGRREGGTGGREGEEGEEGGGREEDTPPHTAPPPPHQLSLLGLDGYPVRRPPGQLSDELLPHLLLPLLALPEDVRQQLLESAAQLPDGRGLDRGEGGH